MTPKGFNFITFLIAIASVLIIITGIFVFVLPQEAIQSRDKQRKADLERIRTNLFDYYTDFNCFPKTIPDCHNPKKYSNPEYFPFYHCDPKDFNYIYQVSINDCPQSFTLFTTLENPKDLDIVKTNCQYNYAISSDYNTSSYTCPIEF